MCAYASMLESVYLCIHPYFYVCTYMCAFLLGPLELHHCNAALGCNAVKCTAAQCNVVECSLMQCNAGNLREGQETKLTLCTACLSVCVVL